MELDKAKAIAEELRKEPWRIFPMRNNCFGKSLRLRKECRRIGIGAKVVFSLGIIRNDRVPFISSVLMPHTWAEIDGQRIELARPLDGKNTWNTLDINIKPVIAIWM